MSLIKKRKGKCSFCGKLDEEDLLLVCRVLVMTVPDIDLCSSPGRRHSLGLGILNEISRLTNFRKLVTDMFSMKYPEIEYCSHSNLAQ